MVNRLFTGTDQKTKGNRQSAQLDHDIHRFGELLDVIDRPVDDNDYEVALKQTPPKPTQSVVEVQKPKPAPVDPQPPASTQRMHAL